MVIVNPFLKLLKSSQSYLKWELDDPTIINNSNFFCGYGWWSVIVSIFFFFKSTLYKVLFLTSNLDLSIWPWLEPEKGPKRTYTINRSINSNDQKNSSQLRLLYPNGAAYYSLNLRIKLRKNTVWVFTLITYWFLSRLSWFSSGFGHF